MILAIQLFICVVFTAIFLHRLVFTHRRPEEPPLIQGWIPWLGVALSYELDPAKFLLSCQRKYGNVFTLYMGGIRAHIVSDPIHAIPTIYRNTKSFTFDPVRKLAAIKVMGLTEENQADTNLYKKLDALQITSLFSSDAVEKMTRNLIKNLEIVLDREMGLEERKVDFWEWVSRVLMEASGKALLGDTFVCDDAMYRRFYDWESRIVEMIKHPNWMLRREIEARTKLVDRLVEMCEQGFVNASSLATNRLRV